MADEFLRSKIYEYGANSNLVLEAERDSKRHEENKGEVESLVGKLDHVKMGDKIKTMQNREHIAGKRKCSLIELDPDTSTKLKKSSLLKAGSNVLLQSNDLESFYYVPKSLETKSVYEEFLRLIQSLIGYQPHDILKSASDEVLSIVKSDMKNSAKQSSIEKTVSVLTPETFSKIMKLTSGITDYSQTNFVSSMESKIDEEMAVVFDDDDDAVDVDDRHFEVTGVDENDDDGVDAENVGQVIGAGRKYEKNSVDDVSSYSVNIHDIDAHWLQRELSKFYTDANSSAQLAGEILLILKESNDRLCENKLVALLDFEKFSLIKLLIKNRAKIYFCSRLKQAQSDEERVEIENEMRNEATGEGAILLQLLTSKPSAENWTKDRMGEFSEKARKEALAITKDYIRNDSEKSSVTETSLTFAGNNNGNFLNLEHLQFEGGNHLMTNKQCELPEKSWRAQKKGYEEVHVPAVRTVVSGEKLVDISNLPSWTHPAFVGIRSLNRVQSKMVTASFYNSDNILLCAPTGAGKTNVALLCILNLLNNYRREDGTFNLDAFKIVYIAPMKALVQECVQSFGKRLSSFGISVRELSGDQNLTRQQIQETQIIVTTPEKWDIVTRKSGDRTYTQLVRLMIIDEIHLLHDERGPVLEGLVARIIRQIEATQDMVRLIGLSATLPNYEDVATFLRVEKKDVFFFDSSYRPVPLQQQYIGITEKKALKRFQLMNEICYEKVLQQAGKNQVLIFTHSRAETVKTASALRELAASNDTLNRFVKEDSASLEILRAEALTAHSADLRHLLPFGFAIHHAGMVRTDRSLVEDLFADKHIQVLVSTATLAWGVNLPCHTVIIKGTQMYSPEQGRWVELSPLDIMQMLGRAGRYGLDSEGEGIIITAHSELQFYLSLMNQQLPIESQFVKKLPDMLNAEIVLGSITSIKDGTSWLAYTYLYVRMLRNPNLYGISFEEAQSEHTLLQRRIQLVHAAALVLEKDGLIKYDARTGIFQVSTLGRVASHYYVSHDTIRVFNENMKPTMNEIEIFRLFSLSGEFAQIRVRDEEKLELSKLTMRVPIPVKENIDEASAKVNILLQSYVSKLSLEGFALVADMTYIQQSACRLMRAIFEISLKRGWASLTAKTLTVCKMIERRIWCSQSPLRQFGNIPEVIIRKLEKNSDITWDRYHHLSHHDFGEMVKIPKMGKTLYKFVHMFPKLLLNAHILPITRSLIKVDLTVMIDFEYDPQIHDPNLLFWVIVEDSDGENILHHEALMLKLFTSTTEPILLTFTVQMYDPMPPQYFIKVVSDRWLHSEVTLPISFRHLILPQRFPLSTELLDLQPLPVTAVSNSNATKLFTNFKYFNAIQTQTFSALFETDGNVLLCAPTGSGKTVCAELAILRLMTANADAKCVYVTSLEAIACSVFYEWKDRLSKLGISVVLLTGESSKDLTLLAVGNVIVSSAKNWDMISRRWKQRKAVQVINLYIFDELHLVGEGSEGVTQEIIVSRARYIASQLERSVRIVALAAPVANALDMGDWIGANTHNIFNFAPIVRSVPLDLIVKTFEINHFSSRILSMGKAVCEAISKLNQTQPVVVFVPSRKQAQLSTIDLISYAAIGGLSKRFCGVNLESKLKAILPRISDPAIANAVINGVGLFYASMECMDQNILESLVRDGDIQVLVVPHDMCWKVNISVHLVVIMDTVYYDGRERRFLDYSDGEILQMVGKAIKQDKDRSTTCVLLCHTPKMQNLRRIINDPLSVESHLNHHLHDHLNAEIVTKTVENKSDAVDYMTWTYYYRRLTHNPNYYNLLGVSYRHLSDHLSDLVENTIADLEESKCVSVENDVDLVPINLGMIASYYYVAYTTIELFASSVTAKTKVKGIIDILSTSNEYSLLPVRQGEEQQLRKLGQHMPHPVNVSTFGECGTAKCKASILLQSHFSRLNLGGDFCVDQEIILKQSLLLLQALVDVISSYGWLRPVLSTIEVSQMVVQGLWNKDAILLQVPHFTPEFVKMFSGLTPPVESVFDLIELLESSPSTMSTLNFSASQQSDIAFFCNNYPNIEVSYELVHENSSIETKELVMVNVSLTREMFSNEDGNEMSFGHVICPRFPYPDKKECWWLIIGDPVHNILLSIKRISLLNSTKVKMEFTAPELPGTYGLVMYLMCDSYMGCDQEYEFDVVVTETSASA